MLTAILNYLFHSYLEVAVKKLFILSVFLFIPIIALLFVQCSESTMDPNDQTALPLYSPGGGVEIVLNNLSFPALLADGYILTDIGYPGFNESDGSFNVPYEGDYTDLTAEEKDALVGYDWYAQKVDGNVWQADFGYTDAVDVSYIDWGDNIESFSPTQGKPFRLEVTLYKELLTSMTGYTMALLENPSSPDEVQGTNKLTYPGALATIASDKAKLVIQPWNWNDEETAQVTPTTWNVTDGVGKWDAQTPEPVVFGVELNVGGKLIYGAAKKGWKPAQTGNYRITYYLLEGSEVNLSNAVIGPAPTDQVASPEVSDAYNLTYVDIVVVPRSGGNTK